MAITPSRSQYTAYAVGYIYNALCDPSRADIPTERRGNCVFAARYFEVVPVHFDSRREWRMLRKRHDRNAPALCKQAGLGIGKRMANGACRMEVLAAVCCLDHKEDMRYGKEVPSRPYIYSLPERVLHRSCVPGC